MATKDQIISSVLAQVGRTDLTARAGEWFDDALNLIHAAEDWSNLSVLATRFTVANGYKYALPVDYRNHQLLMLDTGSANAQKLEYLRTTEFYQRFPRPASLGSAIPKYYTVYDNNMILAPPPSSANWVLNLVYIYVPAVLTGNETPKLLPVLIPALRLALRAFVYADIRSFDKAKEDFDRVGQIIEGARKSDANDSEDEVRLGQFQKLTPPQGDYWANPLIMSV